MKKIEELYSELKMKTVVNPQKSDGYVGINNKIYEALLSVHFNNKTSTQLVLFVIRRTWGWNKKYDVIDISEINKTLGLKYKESLKVLKECSLRNIILAEDVVNDTVNCMLNKYYDTWLYDKIITKKITKPKNLKLPLVIDQNKKQYCEVVYLTDDEYSKLVVRFGEDGTKQRIEELALGIQSKGYVYKSHYHAILQWDLNKNKTKAQRFEPGVPDDYDKRLQDHLNKISNRG